MGEKEEKREEKIIPKPLGTDTPSEVAGVTREQRRDLERGRKGDPGESKLLLVTLDPCATSVYK